MLSGDERRALRDIEQRMERDDPGLARQLARLAPEKPQAGPVSAAAAPPPSGPPRGGDGGSDRYAELLGAGVLILVGTVGILAGVTTMALSTFLWGAAAGTLGGLWWASARRSRRSGRTDGGPP
ncbi:DUF3040 domain-containing protein [Pseudonocardia sp.]|uniref:DUF3040 domain-containing protein n=1 Tax=Pseudonocardia sp. TaxID=60912 RepID=UPI0031FDDB9A